MSCSSGFAKGSRILLEELLANYHRYEYLVDPLRFDRCLLQFKWIFELNESKRGGKIQQVKGARRGREQEEKISFGCSISSTADGGLLYRSLADYKQSFRKGRRYSCY